MTAIVPFIPLITGALGLLKGTPKPPAAVTPAAPAPTRRTDTGASIQLGSADPNARVSGSTGAAAPRQDVLGGLGLGGLNF